MADNGISHNVELGRSLAMGLAALTAIALYNVAELCFIIAVTFKRRSGLYFWSFVVATAGIAIYMLGFILKFFTSVELPMLSITLIVVGWWGMVTGQSVILYSRLHLVLRNLKKLRWVLVMIVTNVIIGHVPTTVLIYGSNSSNPGPFLAPYSFYEKVQITLFFLQESIISGLYIYSTYKILKPAGNIKEKELRQAMTHLIWMNAVVVLFDITLLATEYSGHYEVQVMYKGALYSVKLKIEFQILNHLMELVWKKDLPNSSRERSGTKERSSTHALDDFSRKRTHRASLRSHKATVTSGANAGPGEGILPHAVKDGISVETTLKVERSFRDSRSDADSREDEEIRVESRKDSEPTREPSPASSRVFFAH